MATIDLNYPQCRDNGNMKCLSTNRAHIRDGIGWNGDGRGQRGWDELTEATRPVATTERLDCRRAFLNIMKGGSEDGRMNSLKERCNWGEESERRGEGWVWEGELCRRGEARILRACAKPLWTLGPPKWPVTRCLFLHCGCASMSLHPSDQLYVPSFLL